MTPVASTRVEVRWTDYKDGRPSSESFDWPYGPDLLPSVGEGVYHPETGVALGRVSSVSWHLNRDLVVIQVGP